LKNCQTSKQNFSLTTSFACCQVFFIFFTKNCVDLLLIFSRIRRNINLYCPSAACIFRWHTLSSIHKYLLRRYCGGFEKPFIVLFIQKSKLLDLVLNKPEFLCKSGFFSLSSLQLLRLVHIGDCQRLFL